MRVAGEQMADKQPQWVPMQLTYLGNVQALLQQGGGKLSPADRRSGRAAESPVDRLDPASRLPDRQQRTRRCR